MLLLVHDHKTDGMVAIQEGKVAGEHTPARHYRHEESYLVLEGRDIVIAHDANDLIKHHGYRIATASEMNNFRKLKNKSTALTENGEKE